MRQKSAYGCVNYAEIRQTKACEFVGAKKDLKERK